MKSILFREIKSFFGSPIGYLVIAIYLLLNGLFLWVFEGEFNIPNSGFADLTPYFTLAPWILIFLVPAVTMKSFSDEKRMGTLELLVTKPLSVQQIVGGKFLGSFLLIFLALLPTLIYIPVIWKLGLTEGNLDLGSTIGSYIGLLFLVGAYTSIGIFSSTITDNQIVAFIIAVLICFFLYFGLEGMSGLFGKSGISLEYLGMHRHFESMSRGVLDTRDLVYFISVSILFLSFTVYRIKKMKF